MAAKVYFAEAALFAGDFRRVVALIEPHLGALRGPLRRRRLGTTATVSVDGLGLLAMAYAHLGQFDEALSLGAEVARIADEETCRPFDQGLAHFYYGFARTHRGWFDEAMESLERAAAACEQGDLFMLKPWLDGVIAFSHTRSGRTELARPLFEHAAARARATAARGLQGHGDRRAGGHGAHRRQARRSRSPRPKRAAAGAG